MTRAGYRRCERCGRNRALRFFKPNGRFCETCLRKRVQFASKDQRLQELYGITHEEWQRLLIEQHGLCAICLGRRDTYDVDHSHEVERELVAQGIPKPLATRMSIRGILCRRCNRRLLPAAKDSVEILERAIGYLTEPPADFDSEQTIQP